MQCQDIQYQYKDWPKKNLYDEEPVIGESRGSTARCALSIIDNDHARVVGGVDGPILKNFVLLPSPPPTTRAASLSIIDNDHARVVGGGCL